MFYAVIMAGGSGTRMWPHSRQDPPKQAIRIVGDRSMFQYAVERIASVFPSERIFVVTCAQHAPILKDQMPELPDENFILEPEGRGTAPAIGLAAIQLQRKDPDASMAILTADHYILNVERFCQVLTAAERCAADGSLVTLGIQPTSASTGFGYIKQGSSLGEKNGFTYYAVQEFTESRGYGVVRDFVGHGIGRRMHEPPPIPNVGQAGTGERIKAGMTFAIEPMINQGSPDVMTGPDGWAALTKDRKLSAHFEHSVAVTPDGPRILSAWS